jgi:hypothetical protein
VQTSGRTQREIAGDLGIGLSRLVRWIGRSRDRRGADRATAAESDVTADHPIAIHLSTQRAAFDGTVAMVGAISTTDGAALAETGAPVVPAAAGPSA